MGRDAHGSGEADHGTTAAAVRAVRSGPLTKARAVRRLLAGAIDYAGLFPPASLSLRDAVREYAQYRSGPDAWALGRFVVPWKTIEALAEAVQAIGSRPPWPVSAVVPPDEVLHGTDLVAARMQLASALTLDAIEVPATEATLDGLIPAGVAAGLAVFAEVPVTPDLESVVRRVVAAGAMAKIRTGGVTAGAFPPPAAVVRFLRACLTSGARFKATAGLHHPLRGEYRLTYAADGPSGTMYGYLNLMLAAALVRGGHDDAIVTAALREESDEAIQADGDGLVWRDIALPGAVLQDLRDGFFTGFGSCSFREPLDGLPAALTPASGA